MKYLNSQSQVKNNSINENNSNKNNNKNQSICSNNLVSQLLQSESVREVKCLTTNKYFKDQDHEEIFEEKNQKQIEENKDRYKSLNIRERQKIEEKKQGVINLDFAINQIVINELNKSTSNKQYGEQFQNFVFQMNNEKFDQKEFEFGRKNLTFKKKIGNGKFYDLIKKQEIQASKGKQDVFVNNGSSQINRLGILQGFQKKLDFASKQIQEEEMEKKEEILSYKQALDKKLQEFSKQFGKNQKFDFNFQDLTQNEDQKIEKDTNFLKNFQFLKEDFEGKRKLKTKFDMKDFSSEKEFQIFIQKYNQRQKKLAYQIQKKYNNKEQDIGNNFQIQNTVLDPSLLKTKQQQEREEQEALQMELLRQKFGEAKSPNSQAFKETFMQIKQMLVQNEKIQELYESDLNNNQRKKAQTFHQGNMKSSSKKGIFSQSQDLYQSIRRFVLKERIKNHKGSNFKDVIEYTKILQKEKGQKRLKQSEDFNLDQDILIKIQQPYSQSSLNDSKGKKKTIIIHPRKQSTQFQQNNSGIQQNNQKKEDFGQAKNNINNISFQIVDSLQSPVKSNNGNQSKSLQCNQSDNQLMTNSRENKKKNLEHLNFFKRGYIEKQQKQFQINNQIQDFQEPTEKKLKMVDSEKNLYDFSCQNQVQLRKNKSRNSVKFQDSPKISDFRGNLDIVQDLKLEENFNKNSDQIKNQNSNKFKLRKSQSQHNFISQNLLKKNNTLVMKNGAIINNNNFRVNSSNNIFKNTEINGKLYEMKQKIIEKQKLKNQKEQAQIEDLKESILFQNNNSIVQYQNSNSDQILNTNYGQNKEKEECLKISQFQIQNENIQIQRSSLNKIQDEQIEKKIKKTCDQLEKSKYIEEEQFVQARDYQKKRTFIKNQLSQNYQKQIQNSNNTPKNYAQFVKKQASSNFKNTNSCNTPKSLISNNSCIINQNSMNIQLSNCDKNKNDDQYSPKKSEKTWVNIVKNQNMIQKKQFQSNSNNSIYNNINNTDQNYNQSENQSQGLNSQEDSPIKYFNSVENQLSYQQEQKYSRGSKKSLFLQKQNQADLYTIQEKNIGSFQQKKEQEQQNYHQNKQIQQVLQNKNEQIQVQSQKNLLKIEGLLSEKDKQFQFLTPQKQQEKTRKNSHFFKFCEQKAGQNNQNELLMLRKINTDNSVQSSDLDESSDMK